MSAVAMTLMLAASLSCFAWLMIPRTKLLLQAGGGQRRQVRALHGDDEDGARGVRRWRCVWFGLPVART